MPQGKKTQTLQTVRRCLKDFWIAVLLQEYCVSWIFLFTYVMIGVTESSLRTIFQEFDSYLVNNQWILHCQYLNSILGKLQKLVCSLLSEQNS